MPQRDEVEAFVAAITYKPGWGFRISWPMHERSPILVVDQMVEDVHAPHRQIRITTVRPIPEYAIDTRLGDWRSRLAYEIHDAIATLEGHERLEWLRHDGRWLWHPHPGGPTDSRSVPYGDPFEAAA